MPHIIVEYSDNLAAEIDIRALLRAMHEQLGRQEGVDPARIKSRAIALKDSIVGTEGESGRMIHTTLLLLSGRDDATKKQYAVPLHQLMEAATQKTGKTCAATLEVRDMDNAGYFS